MNIAFPTIPTAPVTQVFGNHNPKLYGAATPYHKGIDYGIIPGTPIYTCIDGRVHTAINQQTGYGRHIRIVHPDGAMSIYGHLNALLVKAGDEVRAGQEIAKSGGDPRDKIDGDGLSTGPHLHWEIRPPGKHASDQTAVDPMAYCLQYNQEGIRIAEVTAFNGLNVRVGAGTGNRVIGSLYRKQAVEVVEVVNGWARIRSLRPEWASAAYLHFTGEVIEPVEVVPPPPALTLEEKVERLWELHPELHY